MFAKRQKGPFRLDDNKLNGTGEKYRFKLSLISLSRLLLKGDGGEGSADQSILFYIEHDVICIGRSSALADFL